MKRRIKIKLLFLSFCLVPGLYAQVTVGTVEMPADGALLQLKTTTGVAGGDKNANGGLLLPRVSLVSYQSLEPILSNVSEEEMKRHAGLVVYNLTDVAPLAKGLAVWNGKQWWCITNKEIEKNIGMEVKKNLYKQKTADSLRLVPIHSIEARMRPEVAGDQQSYAYPQFRMGEGYIPDGDSAVYQYHIAQFWSVQRPGGTVSGYSNDIKKIKLASNSAYTDFINSSLSTEERNEVWMYDSTGNQIFHVHFFIMGTASASDDKIYAVIVERF
jgi:hypothetical protein